MRAQVSLEFMAMLGFAGLFLMVFLGAAYHVFTGQADVAKSEHLNDLGKSIQEEIILASEVHDGYVRSFSIPRSIDGVDYSVYIQGGYLALNDSRNDVLLPLPEVYGSISKGEVTLRKVNGVVQVS